MCDFYICHPSDHAYNATNSANGWNTTLDTRQSLWLVISPISFGLPHHQRTTPSPKASPHLANGCASSTTTLTCLVPSTLPLSMVASRATESPSSIGSIFTPVHLPSPTLSPAWTYPTTPSTLVASILRIISPLSPIASLPSKHLPLPTPSSLRARRSQCDKRSPVALRQRSIQDCREITARQKVYCCGFSNPHTPPTPRKVWHSILSCLPRDSAYSAGVFVSLLTGLLRIPLHFFAHVTPYGRHLFLGGLSDRDYRQTA